MDSDVALAVMTPAISKSLTRNHAVLCPLRATRRSRRNPIASMTQA
jgi:hypothetical protein